MLGRLFSLSTPAVMDEFVQQTGGDEADAHRLALLTLEWHTVDAGPEHE